MKYRKIHFVFKPSNIETTVMCNKPQIFAWAPLCAATFWLLTEKRSSVQNDTGAIVTVYSDDKNTSDALAQYVQHSCARCKFNQANKGK